MRNAREMHMKRSHDAHKMHKTRRRNVHDMLTKCIQHACNMCAKRMRNARDMLSKCTRYAHDMYTTCSRNAHDLHGKCTRNAHETHTICILKMAFGRSHEKTKLQRQSCFACSHWHTAWGIVTCFSVAPLLTAVRAPTTKIRAGLPACVGARIRAGLPACVGARRQTRLYDGGQTKKYRPSVSDHIYLIIIS